MNYKYLIKAIPYLSILIIIICLNILNQKEYTKLKILIWNTPSLSLGTYLAISTGSGFILSYMITTNLSKVNQTKLKKVVRYSFDNKEEEEEEEEVNSFINTDNNITYDNTLIERDIKDPSPTINASFRVIGKTNKKIDLTRNDQEVLSNNNQNLYDESDYQYYKESNNFKKGKENNQISSDWNDDNYLDW